MRAYVITTGSVFGLLVIAHVWRVIEEGIHLARDPFYILVTIAAAAVCVWAWRVLRLARVDGLVTRHPIPVWALHRRIRGCPSCVLARRARFRMPADDASGGSSRKARRLAVARGRRGAPAIDALGRDLRASSATRTIPPAASSACFRVSGQLQRARRASTHDGRV